MDRVANSTPMVDFDSRLNSLRVNRESTVGYIVSDDASFPSRMHTVPAINSETRNAVRRNG